MCVVGLVRYCDAKGVDFDWGCSKCLTANELWLGANIAYSYALDFVTRRLDG